MPTVRVLDLYCCAGGAARGYKLAGATVVHGVDVVPRPNYSGDSFALSDALDYLATRIWPIRIAYDHGGLIRTDLRLCMDMLELRTPVLPPWVQRHRDFEIFGFSVPQPEHRKHRGYVRGMRHGVYRDGPYVAAYGSGGGKATIAEMQHALQMDWTTEREELTEAIPPAYTEYIGAAFAAQSLTPHGRLSAS